MIQRIFYKMGIITLIMAMMLLLYWYYTLLGPQKYQTAPISDFYVNTSLMAEDVCKGSEVQTMISTRKVYGTEDGWKADVTRELFVRDGGKRIKIFEDYAKVNIEPDEGMVTRLQRLPTKLPEGTYFWEISVTLHLPYNVNRNDVPKITSNDFQVILCQSEV